MLNRDALGYPQECEQRIVTEGGESLTSFCSDLRNTL